MSNKVCCVPGCSNSTGSKDVLHKFPNPAKDKDRFNTWVYSVGLPILDLTNDHIFKYRRVCHKHFEEKYWCRNNLLSNIAVPTKNMPGLTLPTTTTNACYRPLKSIQNVMQVSSTKDPEASVNKGQVTVVDAEMKENVESDVAAHYCNVPVIQAPEFAKDIESDQFPECSKTVATKVYRGKKIEPSVNRVQITVVDAEMKENVESDVAANYCNVPAIQPPEFDKDIESHQIPECSKNGTTKVAYKRKRFAYTTPIEQHLRTKLMRVGVKLSKCRSKVKRQAVKIKAMQNICSHPDLSKALDNLPTTAKTLTLLQFREHKKDNKGRRFTLKEKLMALSIYKQSPKGYRFFRKIFILPSPQTLVKLINMADVKPGINEKIMQQIKKATEKIKNVEDRLCILLYDEMSLKCNGSFGKRKKYGKPLLGAATHKSKHRKVWQESKRFLKSMKFINTKTLKVERVPTLNNWVWTIEGIEALLKKVNEKYGVNSVWMRHLNQDPIENFFGSIRSHGCRNVNPSPEKFESAFTTLLVNSLSSDHTPGANCETDNCYALSDIIITDSDCKQPNVCEISNIPDIIITPLEEKNEPRIMGALQYVSGYFVKSAKKHIFKGCSQCKKDMLTADELEYIKYREYTRNKKWLCSPSRALLSCISSLQDINYTILKENLEKKHLFEFIKTMILIHVPFDFIKCEKHKELLINYIIKITCRFFIFHYCKEINKILYNKRECDDETDIFKVRAKKYHQKCMKRKINKN